MITRAIQIEIPSNMIEMSTQVGWNITEYLGPLDMCTFVRHIRDTTIYTTFKISTGEMLYYNVIHGGKR